MTLEIASLCGSFCVDPDDGAMVCAQARESIGRGESVHLDFTGVDTLTSSFLNAALGCLYGSFPAQQVASKLTWGGVDSTDSAVIELVRDNAIRYFAAPPEQREKLDQARASILESAN